MNNAEVFLAPVKLFLHTLQGAEFRTFAVILRKQCACINVSNKRVPSRSTNHIGIKTISEVRNFMDFFDSIGCLAIYCSLFRLSGRDTTKISLKSSLHGCQRSTSRPIGPVLEYVY